MDNERFRRDCIKVFIFVAVNNLISYASGIYHREAIVIYIAMAGQLAIGIEIIVFNFLLRKKEV